MKYSKIIKENFQSKFTYIFTIIFSCLFFILLCFGSTKLYLITTWFSGGADINESDYKVTYYANMPEGVFSALKFKIYGAQFFYEVRDNEFGTPANYEFIGWNTSKDGSGQSYQKGSIVLLESDFALYAQWKSLSDENINNGENNDDVVLPDDDVDLPDNDDDDDDKPVGDNENTENDSPNDEIIDDTEDNLDNGTTEDEDNNLNEDNFVPEGTGQGSGTSGSGAGSSNGSSGNTDENYENQTPTTNNNGSVNNSANNGSVNDNIFKDEDKLVIKIYKFSFFNNNMLFSTTSCEVLEDDTCMLVLPANTPNIEGRNFLGWSTNSNCDAEIINDSLKVNSNKEYYACYDEYLEKNDNNIIYLIVSIWCVAGILIYVIIRKYKKNNINKNND